MGIVGRDECVDGLPEMVNAAETGSAQRLASQHAEPDATWLSQRACAGVKCRCTWGCRLSQPSCLGLRCVSLKRTHVVEVLNRICAQCGAPRLFFCDNGSEFSSQIMDLWAYQNGAKIDFSRPGKPTDNAYIESFNGTLRAECLDTHWFGTLEEAKETIEAWQREYNTVRPHQALGYLTPLEFLAKSSPQRKEPLCH